MLPPHMRRLTQHSIGKAGRLSEKKLSREIRGKARPASGAMQGAKGDIDLGDVLLEAKSTTRDSLSVKLDWLCKIKHEARQDGGKTPALSISFVDANGQPKKDGQWIAIPLSVWNALRD